MKTPNTPTLDYKNTEILKKCMDDHGRILARKRTHVSAKRQREIENAVKRARFMGLLPFISR